MTRAATAILLTLTSATSCLASSQQPLPAPTSNIASHGLLSANFDQFVDVVMAKWAVQGLSVALVKKDSSGNWHRELRSWGVSDRYHTPVTEDTLFNIASNSKLFTALSLGLLVENNTYSNTFTHGWDTKVSTIIPRWAPQDPILRKNGNLVDILSHRTGLPRHDYSYTHWDSLEDVVLSKVSHLRPSVEFRQFAQYNNIMYATAAYIIQKTSRIPFPIFVADNILTPLGMSSTTYSGVAAFQSRRLAEGFALARENVTDGGGYGWWNNEYRPIPYWIDDVDTFNAGAGGVISSANDIATWLQTLLSYGRHPTSGRSVIPEAAVRHAATAATIFSPVQKYPEVGSALYGAGQIIYHYHGHQLIEHGGSTPGFRSQITRFPDDDLGIALLTNSDTATPAIDILKFRIAEVYLGTPPERWVDWDSRKVAEALQASEHSKRVKVPRRKDAPLPRVSLSSLTGKYSNPAYGTIELCILPASSDSAAPRYPDPSTSATCQNVIASAAPLLTSSVLPQTSAPRLIAYFPRIWISHFIFTHFSEDIFNITTYNLIEPAKSPTARDSSEAPFALSNKLDDEVSYMTFDVEPGCVSGDEDGGAVVGFGWRGMWGAGAGVASPKCSTIQEQSEI